MKSVKISYLFATISLLFIFSCEKMEKANEKDAKLKPDVSSSIRTSKVGSLYYWSSGKKIELQTDSSALIFLSQDPISTAKNLKQIDAKSTFRKLKSDYYLIEGKERINLSLITSSIKHVQYAFKTLESHRLIPTGEIIIQPKNGVDISTIIRTSGDSLVVSRKTKYGTYVLRIEGESSVLDVANLIYESGLVDYSLPNFIADIKRESDDPFYSSQYYLSNTGQLGGTAGIDINLNDANPSSNYIPKVAVIDDGVEEHEDLSGRILSGYTPNYPSEFGSPAASGKHGEACAGIIAASKDNNIGIAGIASNARIIPINIFRGEITTEELAASIDWAWDLGGADVLSNSWSFTSPTADFDNIRQAITRARTLGRGGKGSIVVFSSGNSNESWSGVLFPGKAAGVVTVGAIDNQGTIWGYSSRGAEMDLVAPSGGVPGNVYTIDRMGSLGYESGNYTATFNGTSASCPQVSGVAALILSINPDFTETQVVNFLTSTATDMGSSGFDNVFGYGRLNATEAIYAATGSLFSLSIQGETNEICSNDQSDGPYLFTINNPPGSTVAWTVNKLVIVGASTGSSVSVLAVQNALGIGKLYANVTIPGYGVVRLTKVITLRHCIS